MPGGADREVIVMSTDDILKLTKLLDFWIEHNQEHGDEFAEWANKAKLSGREAIHKDLMDAAKLMNEANISLKHARATLHKD